MQSSKKIGIKLYEQLCSRGTLCLYIEGEKTSQFEKKRKKKDLTIISKPLANPQTMKKTHAKFHNNRYKLRSQEVPTVYIYRVKMAKFTMRKRLQK